ncbi:MAG TPA: 50S ribosomal protein L31 [Anaeromyxobacteraceae bacterium]|jgi:large subunit ribosomal protein L31|nr:50S ribosomal protein L31 [Anaeromyxobacteraceae bacterium]
MKEGIHPDYKPTKVLCACGNEIVTRSVRGDFHIEICSACHPFFTGKQKIMDTAGRIEKFKNRYGATPATEAPKKAAAAPAPAAKKAEAPKENRAAKRAKVNAGKPKKVEAAPEAAEAPAAEPKAE